MQFHTPLLIFEEPVKDDFKKVYASSHWRFVYKRHVLIWHRTRVAESQNWRCCWCGIRMTEERGHKHSVTVEHVVPRSKGGADDPKNYAASCDRCNSLRGDLEPHVFLDTMARSIAKARLRQELREHGIMGGQGKKPKLSKRQDQLAAMKAVRTCKENPFEPDTRTHKLFERYRNSEFYQTAG